MLDGLGMDLDAGLRYEATVVRPTLFSDEMLAGLAAFAAGERPEAPRPPD